MRCQNTNNITAIAADCVKKTLFFHDVHFAIYKLDPILKKKERGENIIYLKICVAQFYNELLKEINSVAVLF